MGGVPVEHGEIEIQCCETLAQPLTDFNQVISTRCSPLRLNKCHNKLRTASTNTHIRTHPNSSFTTNSFGQGKWKQLISHPNSI